VTFPTPMPLDPPPGDPGALAELISAVSGAAFGAGVLSANLATPAASAPGWLGADAAAAAEQLTSVAALAQQLCGALNAAEQRLRAHAQVLDDARQRIVALRRAQAEDFAVAWTHVAQSDPDLARPIVEDLEAAEADRRRAHAAAVADVTDDATATAQVLDGSTTGLGGTGEPGQGAGVLTHLATLLPGWGDGELIAQARADAESVLRGSPSDAAAWLRSAGPLLDVPAFATAFLQALDRDGTGWVLNWTATADEGADLAGGLAHLLRAAATSSDAGRRVVSLVVDFALDGPNSDPTATVALGRLAAAGAFAPAVLRSLAGRLAEAEAASLYLRRDQLAVAPGEDPLDSVLEALAAAGDADEAALLVADAQLWPAFLGREWTEGVDGLTAVVRLAAGGDSAGAATLVVLGAIARTRHVLLTSTTTGSPEAFTVGAISPAVADLVAARPEALSEAVLAGQGSPGVPSRALDESEQLALIGLGIVGLDPDARPSLLRWLTDATSGAPLPSPGLPDPAAYVEGGIFAALASGEAFDIRHQLYSATARQEADERTWNLLLVPLSFLPLRGVAGFALDVATSAAGFMGPDGVPWESFLRQPRTGADQAAYAAVVARAASMVKSGQLPHPGHALEHGLGSEEARAYEARLSPEAREAWNGVVFGAEDGFLDVGHQLGILPGG
jgi:hypothetical protein